MPEYDGMDWLEEAREEVHAASRAGKGAERYKAIKRAQTAIDNAATMAEREILTRWQAVGMDTIIPAEVAPAADYQADLAQDMRALGWRMENRRYVRPRRQS